MKISSTSPTRPALRARRWAAVSALVAPAALASLCFGEETIGRLPSEMPETVEQRYRPYELPAIYRDRYNQEENYSGRTGRITDDRTGDRIPFNFIFFPPTPPAVDGVVIETPAISHIAPPRELAAYVNEPFYAQLSSLLFQGMLTNRLRQRLDAYRAVREELQNELRVELSHLRRQADPASRRQALEVLARKQAPRLAAVEETAENLRADMAKGPLGWFAQRERKLDKKGGTQGDLPAEVAEVVRAYAYYHQGVSLTGRGLLLELAMELDAVPENKTVAVGASPYFFFSPETARVQLPADLPAPTATKIAAYQTKKSALKKELYEAVFEQESENTTFFRGNILRSVSAGQATRVAELETLAGEIRRDLATLTDAAPHREPLAESSLNFRAAVFEPGLSLAQRRLLFGGAMVDLHLSLPWGSLQPKYREAVTGGHSVVDLR